MHAARLALALTLTLVLGASGAGAQITCLTDPQCADGNLCNGVERCVGSQCQAGPPLVCDDGDPCTIDSCKPSAGCAHADEACPAICGPGNEGQRCSDGTACTVGDVCQGGACVGTPLVCDDADPCTVDGCDSVLGCVYSEQASPPACVTSADCRTAADHAPCVGDGDPCTQDGCLEGACRIGLIQFVRQCPDADTCNGQEFCSPVKGCQPGPPLVCDDGDLCNGAETCNPASGCQAGTPEPDGTICDDGRACTVGEQCLDGACAGLARDCDDANAATRDLCLEPSGCLHCVALDKGKLVLTFPAGTKPGKFTTGGAFAPLGGFDPTTAAGADLVLHDAATVFQRSHVAGDAFVANARGTTQKFADKSGALAGGLTALTIKAGAADRPFKFTARGIPTGPGFGGNAGNDVTLVAGSACASVRLPCARTPNGKVRKCRP